LNTIRTRLALHRNQAVPFQRPRRSPRHPREAKIVFMRWRLWLILILQAVLVLLLAIAVETGVMPLGVRGEWQCMRLGRRVSIPWDWLALAGLGVAASAGFVGVGLRALTASRPRWSEASWLAALLAAAI